MAARCHLLIASPAAEVFRRLAETMEGVRRRRPGQEHSGASSRESESISSKESRSLGEKGDNWHRSERRMQKVTGMGKGSHSKGATTRQSQGPRSPRPGGWGSPDGPLSSRHTENGHPEEKVRGRPPPTPGRRKDKSASTGAGHQDRGDWAHRPPQLNSRSTRPRSPARTTGQKCCQEDPESRPASPKLRNRCLPRRPRSHSRSHSRHCLHRSRSGPRSPRSPSARARAPLDELVPRLGTQVGGLQVVLDELRAPGGAFLPVPSSGPQPEVREPEARHRAWLSWQLAHTGANLHWALTALDSLLAAQPVLPAPPPCPPRAPQP